MQPYVGEPSNPHAELKPSVERDLGVLGFPGCLESEHDGSI